MAINTSSPNFEDPIVIIGAGCFGASTAFHLMKRGFKDVTILDRSHEIPGADVASNDFNRIVRSSYSDKIYADLARDAIKAWKDDAPIFGNAYHESGVMAFGVSSGQGNSFVEEAYQNDKDLGSNVELLRTHEDIKSMFNSLVEIGPFPGQTGYLNRDNGWADAGLALRSLHKALVELGCKIQAGKTVTGFLSRDGVSYGVKCSDGSELLSRFIVLATGAWTSAAFPDLHLPGLYRATGQSVAMIQLTPEEAQQYRDIPVVISFDSGFYLFPPTDSGILKVAIHGPGVVHPNEHGISTPRTISSNPADGHFIPKTMLEALRTHLAEIFPAFVNHPTFKTRLCWYSDTFDGDWIIGQHPRDPSIIMATGDSGHAFKFLPTIGSLVADSIQGKLASSLASKFSPSREVSSSESDPTRHGQNPLKLEVDQLCTEADYVRSRK